MEKTKYNISHLEGIKPLTGYVFTFGKLRYGVTNRHYNGNTEVTGYTWRITELTTGYLIGVEGSTRKAAVNKLVSRENDARRTAINILINNEFKGKDINPGLQPQTTILVAR